MNTFFYNQGTSAHRGVWHLARSIKIETVPEVVRPAQEYECIDWKGETDEPNFLPGIEYYIPDHQYLGYRQKFRKGYPILGRSTAQRVIPEHQTFIAQAACGSGKFTGKNLTGEYSSRAYKIATSKKSIGKDLGRITEGRVVELLVREGGNPPEPFCQHCFRLLVERDPEDIREDEE